jgi:hypothetical protein
MLLPTSPRRIQLLQLMKYAIPCSFMLHAYSDIFHWGKKVVFAKKALKQ